jgi:glycosyltransferase involved in cell wall biosynthesis
VCHLVAALDYGGVERQMRIIADSTLDRRGSMHFVAIGDGGRTADAIAGAGHDVTLLRRTPSVYSAGAFPAVLQAIRRLRPDVVHTHGAESNFHGLPAAFLARVPVRIGEEIGLPSLTLKARLAFRLVYRFAQRVVAVSDMVADDMVRGGEVARDDVVVVEYPYRPLPPAPPRRRHDRTRLRCCAVNRLVEWKKVHEAIEALHVLAARGRPFDLWVIGDGPERAALEAMTADRNLGEYVTFFGFQDRPEDYLRECDVFLMPSANEGCSIALIEAMAMGMPVVATDVGIAPQVLRNDETGWIVPVGDREALVETLDRVLALPDEVRDAVGAAGQRRVLDRNSPAEHVARLDALYAAVRAGGRARAGP